MMGFLTHKAWDQGEVILDVLSCLVYKNLIHPNQFPSTPFKNHKSKHEISPIIIEFNVDNVSIKPNKMWSQGRVLRTCSRWRQMWSLVFVEDLEKTCWCFHTIRYLGTWPGCHTKHIVEQWYYYLLVVPHTRKRKNMMVQIVRVCWPIHLLKRIKHNICDFSLEPWPYFVTYNKIGTQVVSSFFCLDVARLGPNPRTVVGSWN